MRALTAHATKVSEIQPFIEIFFNRKKEKKPKRLTKNWRSWSLTDLFFRGQLQEAAGQRSTASTVHFSM